MKAKYGGQSKAVNPFGKHLTKEGKRRANKNTRKEGKITSTNGILHNLTPQELQDFRDIFKD